MKPEQAFDLICKLADFKFDEIRKSSTSVKIYNQDCFIVTWDYLSIDWGDATNYRPPKYRPVRKSDVVKALNGENVRASQPSYETPGVRRELILNGWISRDGKDYVWVHTPDHVNADMVLNARHVEVLE